MVVLLILHQSTTPGLDEQSCLHKAEGKSKVAFEQKGLIPA